MRLPSSELQVDALIELFTAADATSVEELTDAELSSSGIDEVALKLMAEICEGPSGAKKWQAIGRLLDKPSECGPLHNTVLSERRSYACWIAAL